MSGIVGSKFNHRGSGLVGSLGTDGQHMLSAGAGKSNVFETPPAAYNDELIKSDLTALAIREATNESSAAFNLPGSFIETFQDDTNLGTQTDGDRISGYWVSATPAATSQAATVNRFLSSLRSSSFESDASVGSEDADMVDGTRTSGGNSGMTGTIGFPQHVRVDLGVGQSFVANEFGVWTFVDSGSYFEDCNLQGSNDNTNWTTLKSETGNWTTTDTGHHFDNSTFTNTTAYRYYKLTVTKGRGGTGTEIQWHDFSLYNTGGWTSYGDHTFNATGTLIQSANSVTGSRTSVGGTMLYKDNAGTATLGTDLKIYFTANGGTNWTEAAGYNAITPVYASGIKQVRLSKTTVTGGTDVRYKAVFANQSGSSKETELHGIGINY